MPLSTIKIVLVDDHEVFRIGMRSIISTSPRYSVIADVENAESLFQVLERHHCDVVILDLKLPGQSGVAILTTIKKRWPKLKVVVLTVFHDAEHVKVVLKAKADAYILKTDSVKIIWEAIDQVSQNKLYLSPTVAAETMTSIVTTEAEAEEVSIEEVLTRRELQIFKLVATGASNKDIADSLGLSIRTIEAHRANIYDKLRIKTVVEAMKLAFRLGIGTSTGLAD